MKIFFEKSEDPRCQDFNELIEKRFPEFLEEKNPDLILVSGGDGAMLHSARKYNNFNVPFLGHARGTLNFLLNDFGKKEEKIIEKLVNNEIELHIEKTKAIKIDIKKSHGSEFNVGYAVNEVVIGNSIMGYHHFEVNSENGAFKDLKMKGSGISICTDLGSTGYNFNLGGPMLPMGKDLWVIMAVICNRYLHDLVEAQSISIDLLSDRDNCNFFIDGVMNKEKLETGDRLLLSEGREIKLAFLDNHSFEGKRIDLSSRYRKS